MANLKLHSLNDVKLVGRLTRDPEMRFTTNGVPARWLASAGTNQVVVTVFGTEDEVLFDDWLAFELAPPFTVSNATHSAISNVFLYGQKLSQPPPGVSGFLDGTTASSFLVSTQNVSLVIGLTYVPAETRKYAPVQTSTPPGPVLTAARLPGGEIQFTFEVAAGVPYSIETSVNLTTWQTLTNDVGQAGSEVYLNPSPTNAVEFYRVKL